MQLLVQCFRVCETVKMNIRSIYHIHTMQELISQEVGAV